MYGLVVWLGDFCRHVGEHMDGLDVVHGGYGIYVRGI